DALTRSLTTSLESICLASLVVAIIETLRKVLQLVEVLNYWAFVYVAVYGISFVMSVWTVLQLFQTRGFTVLLNDNLLASALEFTRCGAFFIGLAVAMVTLGGIESAAGAVIVCFVENPEASRESHFGSLLHGWQRNLEECISYD
ncbi:hypothetical protein SPRG_15284, partial [Saprolegnia parasitica CBS 223.65]